MKKALYLGLALVALFAASAPVYSIEIDITAPKVTSVNTGEPALDTLLMSMFTQTADNEFNTAINELETKTNKELAPYGEQDLFAKGFANANAYSAQSATLQGYQGYKLFALMGGVLVGAQSPSFDAAELQAIGDTIEEDPDIYAGVAPSMSFNLGLNAGKIFGLFSEDLGNTMNNFYFNIKYGTLSYTYPIEEMGDLVMNSTNFGMGVNYQWLPASKSVLFGLFKWRGVNFGSGFFVQSNSVEFSSELDPLSEEFRQTLTQTYGGYTAYSDVTADLVFTPKVNLGIEMTTFSIPLEATTSVQLLWLLNFNFGAGLDLVFGKTDITADASSSLVLDNIEIGGSSIGAEVTPGSVKLDAGTKGISPSLMRARLMTGVGLQLGPVKVDVPVYYYFNTGLATGMTVGIVW